MKISLFHAESGDWVGLYVDDKLIMEGHSLPEGEMLKTLAPFLGFEFCGRVSQDEYLERYGNRCPENWNEILEKEG